MNCYYCQSPDNLVTITGANLVVCKRCRKQHRLSELDAMNRMYGSVDIPHYVQKLADYIADYDSKVTTDGRGAKDGAGNF